MTSAALVYLLMIDYIVITLFKLITTFARASCAAAHCCCLERFVGATFVVQQQPLCFFVADVDTANFAQEMLVLVGMDL